MLGQTDTNQHKEVPFGEVFYFIFFMQVKVLFLIITKSISPHSCALYLTLIIFCLSTRFYFTCKRDTCSTTVTYCHSKREAVCLLFSNKLYCEKAKKKGTFLNVSVMQLLKKTQHKPTYYLYQCCLLIDCCLVVFLAIKKRILTNQHFHIQLNIPLQLLQQAHQKKCNNSVCISVFITSTVELPVAFEIEKTI